MFDRDLSLSLSRCMEYVGLRDLPTRWDGRAFWTRAIVRVRRRNFTDGYMVAYRDDKGRIRYVYDGSLKTCAVVVCVPLLEVYPFKFLPTVEELGFSREEIESDVKLARGVDDAVLRDMSDDDLSSIAFGVYAERELQDEKNIRGAAEVLSSIMKSTRRRGRPRKK